MLKVVVKMYFEDIEGVALATSPIPDFSPIYEVDGTESMVLVDKEQMRNVLEHHGAAGSRSNWCNWPDCGWSGEGTEHTCPLREEA